MGMNPRLLRPILSGDPDALRYIAAVQQADQQSLEPAVRKAITDFVVGCKSDGIWSAIKASCVLMGARTLSGALTPLVGSAPTNNGPFVSGDYDRKTGLVGNGSTKFINTGRNNNADPQDNNHNAAFVTSVGSGVNAWMGCGSGSDAGTNQMLNSSGSLLTRSRGSSFNFSTSGSAIASLFGFSRSASASYSRRVNGSGSTGTYASAAPFNGNILLFGRGTTASPISLMNARIAFYSIGESLDLALLDTRVNNLYNAIGAAI